MGLLYLLYFLTDLGEILCRKSPHRVIPLGSYELHENWCTESLALCKDLNEILFIFSTFFLIWRSQCMRYQ